jgi:hypothetical protein
MNKQTERNGQPRRGLSEQQRTAVELLAVGKTDKEAGRPSGWSNRCNG